MGLVFILSSTFLVEKFYYLPCYLILWLILVAPALLPCSKLSLYISAFLALGDGETKADSSYGSLKAEEAGPLPCSPFPGEGSSFRPGRADGELDEAGKMKLPLLFFLCSYSCFYLFVCSTILLKFLVWTPELPQSYFCSQIAVKLLIFVGGWRLASPNPVFL